MAFDVPERFLGWVHGQWPCSKHGHHARPPRASLDSPCSRAATEGWFRQAEIGRSAKMASPVTRPGWQHDPNRAYCPPALIRRLPSSCPPTRLQEPRAFTSGRTRMHHRVLSHVTSIAFAGLLTAAVASSANAQKKYD